MRIRVSPFGFTSQPLASRGDGDFRWNGEAVGLDTRLGFNWPSRGFLVDRILSADTLKAGGRWAMTHSDGTEYVAAYSNLSLYEDTGSDLPIALNAGMTMTFVPSFVPIGYPAGIGVFLNGTNSQARVFRKAAVSTDLETALFDMAAPAAVALAQAAAGALPDGTYFVAQQFVDAATGQLVVRSSPTVDTITVAAGGGAASINVPAPAAPPVRATNRRLYIGTVNSPTTLFFVSEVAIGAGTQNITALSASIVTPENRNGAYQTAVMPLANASVACEHMGRLFIGALDSGDVYWTERDAPNQWYATNTIKAEADGGWNGHVRGLASLGGVLYVFTTAGVFAVTGSFARDTLGENPTYRADVAPPYRVSPLACVAHGSIAPTANAVFFMSDQGPAVLASGGRVELLEPEHVAHYLDRLDWAYVSRWPGCVDPKGFFYCLGVTRLVNSSRPADGGANAGFCDRIMRFDIRHARWATPLAIGDFVHLSAGRAGVSGAASTRESFVYAFGAYGRILKLDLGWSGGGPLDVSGAVYDAKLATANTATTAVVTQAGVGGNTLIGNLVVLKYPDDDANYPGWLVERSISGNDTSGSDLTLAWQGALTVPSGSGKWTVRIAGRLVREDIRDDWRRYAQMRDPGGKLRLKCIAASLHHVVGAEAVS